MRGVIYLDHAATTPPAPEVIEAMLPALREDWGNPSSLYSAGRRARRIVEGARELAAAFFGCSPDEILFTSGGSESDNLALRGAMHAVGAPGDHLVTTAVEHHAVIHAARVLEREGFRITLLQPDRYGRIDAAQVEEAITPATRLISVMHGNNEVGTLQPVEEIGALARRRGILFHTDAVQSVGQIPIQVRDMPCDLLSMSAHKVYGPKGAGLLYRRTGVPLVSQIAGGDQEMNARAGTENVPGIAGLARALELAFEGLQNGEPERMAKLRDRLIEGLLAGSPGSELTGHPALRLPNNASFRFPGIEGEPLLLNLDMCGICGSSGAACATGEIEPSHVLLAAGYSRAEAHGALRLTLGRDNTPEQIEQVISMLPPLVESLRRLRTPPPKAGAPGLHAG